MFIVIMIEYIYMAYVTDYSLIKIGRTKRNISIRFKEYARQYNGLELFMYVPVCDMKKSEKELKNTMRYNFGDPIKGIEFFRGDKDAAMRVFTGQYYSQVKMYKFFEEENNMLSSNDENTPNITIKRNKKIYFLENYEKNLDKMKIKNE
jgi:hypothetical protein